jgi:dolichyl-phosphate beta-glucosyltransferase
MARYFDSQPYTYELLVVDDGSTDRTREVAREAAPCRSLCVLHYDGNRGKGHAVRFGMLHASGSYVLFSDADLATPIEEVEPLFRAIEAGADIAIGSRDVPGSKLIKRQSLFREMGGKLFNRCVQMIAVPGIHDTQCGFKLFASAASASIFSRCQIDNFSFDVEVLYLARLLGYKVAEVPVRWAHQEGSKVVFRRDAPRMLKTLVRIRLNRYALEPRSCSRTAVP